MKLLKKPINKETNNEILDTELKDDYMDLIKAQNKKIQGLFSEIEKKDKLLSQFKIQLKAFEEIKVENNFLLLIVCFSPVLIIKFL